MMQQFLKNGVILLITIILCNSAYSAIERSNTRAEGTAVTPTEANPANTQLVIDVEDNKYPYLLNSGSVFTNVNSEGRLTVGIDWESAVAVQGPYTYRFDFIVKIWNSHHEPIVVNNINNLVSLYVDYNNDPTQQNASFRDQATYRVQNPDGVGGVYKMSVELVNIYAVTIDVTGAEIETLVTKADWDDQNNPVNPRNLYVETEIITERYYVFDPNYLLPANRLEAHELLISGEDEITWDYITGAEEYELEWTYVDSYDKDLQDLTYDFKNNATRVILSGNSYRVPRMFEQGYVLYRVRGIGRKANGAYAGEKIYGRWTSDNFTGNNYVSGFGHKYIVNPHEQDDLNWQYQASFAEEGKSRHVVSYADGTGRSRETVARMQSTEQALVAQTLYDYQGRGVVNVLPAPADGSALKYYDNFNMSFGNPLKEYSREDFDKDPNNDDDCSPSYFGMSDINGSPKYYSPGTDLSKPYKTWQNYLPNAEDNGNRQWYPFAQVEYEPDNSGLVRRQSGVGPDHRLGKGLETKFYYGPAKQEELDRLFGNEVGDHSHYSKDLTVDANGQVSISYKDMYGRVIATALAGGSATGLEDLYNATVNGEDIYQPGYTIPDPNEPADAITMNVFTPGNAQGANSVTDGNSIVYTSPFSVDGQNKPHTFAYSLTGSEYSVTCFLDEVAMNTECYDCIYDLEISIKDECGDYIVGDNGQPLYIYIDEALQVNGICAETDNDYNDSWTAVLNTGTYYIEKRLTVNEDAMEAYLAHYINASQEAGCIPTLESLIDAIVIDPEACDGINCEDCMESLLNTNLTSQQLAIATAQCEEMCNETQGASLCQMRYQMMLGDVSPNGQYGEVEFANNIYSAADPLSIFNDNNHLPLNTGSIPLWRNANISVLDEDGIVRTADALNTATTDPNDYYISLTEFIEQWDDTWAEQLVQYHPEYCYFTWCDENISNIPPSGTAALSSDAFDLAMLTFNFENGITTLQNLLNYDFNGVILNLLDPIGACNITGGVADPYYTQGGIGADGLNYMQAKMTNYSNSLDMWEYAEAMENCGSAYGGIQALYDCMGDINSCGYERINTREEWENFRKLYLSSKQRMQQLLGDFVAVTEGCYSGCIGADDGFNPAEVPFFYHSGNGGTSPFFSWQEPVQPCSFSTFWYYLDSEEKIRRFGDAAQSLPENSGIDPYGPVDQVAQAMENETDYTYYEQTGQCPLEVDLQAFLSGLLNPANANPELTGTSNLINADGFTLDLFNAIYDSEQNYDPNNQWVASVTNNVLTGEFTDAPVTCELTLNGTPNQHNTIDFTEILGFANLQGNGTSFTVTVYLPDDAVLYPYTDPYTNITTWVHDDADNDLTTQTGEQPDAIVISGTFCIPLGECSFADVCTPSPLALNIQDLLSALAAPENNTTPGNLTVSGTTISPQQEYSFVCNPLFATLGLQQNIFTQPYTWHYNSSLASFEIHNNSNTVGLSVDFNPLPNGLTFDDIDYFTGIRPDPSIEGYFTVYAVVVPDAPFGAEPVYYSLSGTVNAGSPLTEADMGFCHPPVPLNCQDDYNMNRMHLDNLFSTMAQQGGTSANADIELNMDPAFTALLHEQVTSFGGIIYWKVQPNPNNNPELNIFILDTEYSDGTCSIKISTANALANGMYNAGTSTYSSYSDYFAHIQNFSNLQADYVYLENGQYSYHFTVTAHFAGGNTEVLQGETSCWALANCRECDEGENVSNGEVAQSAQYIQGLDNGFGLSSGSGLDEATGTNLTEGTYVITENGNGYTYVTSPNQPLGGASSDAPLQGGSFMLIAVPNSLDFVPVLEGNFAVQPGTEYVFDALSMIANADASLYQQYAAYSGLCLRFELISQGANNVEQNRYLFLEPQAQWRKQHIEWTSPLTGSMNVTLRISTRTLSKGIGLGLDQVRFYKKCAPYLPVSMPVLEYVNPCMEELQLNAEANATNQYNELLEDLTAQFRTQYMQHCLGASESMTASYVDREFHHTLYYYDQAGNLVKTVPPKGVNKLDPAATALVDLHRQNPGNTQYPAVFPPHKFETAYIYNSLGQVVRQSTPDTRNHDPQNNPLEEPFEAPGEEEETHFWYDKLGRIIASQNPEQAVVANDGTQRYSYTRYDALGRVVEAGELHTNTNLVQLADPANNTYNTLYTQALNPTTPGVIFPASMLPQRKTEVSRFYYDEPLINDIGFRPQYLRGRVAAATIEEIDDSNDQTYDYGTHYSYDISGNVKTMLQENKLLTTPGQQRKYIDYEYDLVSGNTNKVTYQPGFPDQFIHRYEYDADNRLSNVYTSHDGLVWDQDAKYFYYDHGPLARVELGQHKVQGIDYAYTIQGWLKGVNSNKTNPLNDQGKDAHPDLPFVNNTGLNRNIAHDEYGYTLGYYTGDYQAVNSLPGANHFEADITGSELEAQRNNLYNGNITHMVTTLKALGPNSAVTSMAFKYDQLNRLKKAVFNDDFIDTDPEDNAWGTAVTTNYASEYNYDANGNLLELNRNAYGTNNDMDRLQYHYQANTNRLQQVEDIASASFVTDIQAGQTSENYIYNRKGNLVINKQECIEGDQNGEYGIEWTVYGKIKKVKRKYLCQLPGSAEGVYPPDLEFKYDAAGNRIAKVIKYRDENGNLLGPTGWDYTYYVYDPAGTNLAILERDIEPIGVNQNTYSDIVKLVETPIFGSERIGILNNKMELANREFSSYGFNLNTWQPINPEYSNEEILSSSTSEHNSGLKRYELADHLSNVLGSVSDRVIINDLNGDNEVDNYSSLPISVTSFYPFGMEMPIPNQLESNYRYGFNGKEINKEFGTTDFELRSYSPQLGRFFSRDPYERYFHNQSTYSFAANSPISLIDYEGGYWMTPEQIKKYPKLANVLVALSNLVNDPSITPTTNWIVKFSEAAGLCGTPDQNLETIRDILTWGEGPEVVVESFKDEQGGTPAGMVKDDAWQTKEVYFQKSLVKQLENFRSIKTGAKFRESEIQMANMVQMLITALHEGGHYADVLIDDHVPTQNCEIGSWLETQLNWASKDGISKSTYEILVMITRGNVDGRTGHSPILEPFTTDDMHHRNLAKFFNDNNKPLFKRGNHIVPDPEIGRSTEGGKIKKRKKSSSGDSEGGSHRTVRNL